MINLDNLTIKDQFFSADFVEHAGRKNKIFVNIYSASIINLSYTNYGEPDDYSTLMNAIKDVENVNSIDDLDIPNDLRFTLSISPNTGQIGSAKFGDLKPVIHKFISLSKRNVDKSIRFTRSTEDSKSVWCVKDDIGFSARYKKVMYRENVASMGINIGKFYPEYAKTFGFRQLAPNSGDITDSTEGWVSSDFGVGTQTYMAAFFGLGKATYAEFKQFLEYVSIDRINIGV